MHGAFTSHMQFPLLAQLAQVEIFNWLVGQLQMKEGWRSAKITSGELCVMTYGVHMMLEWFADNWDMLMKVNNILISELSVYLEHNHTGSIAYSYSYFGEGTGGIFLDNVGCTGSEIALINCSHRGIGVHDCDHTDDAGVTCHGNDNHIKYSSYLI